MTSKVLFFSYVDGNNDTELWDYNGTTFVEVTAGVQALSGGIYPSYLDAFNNELIFEGANASGVEGMWVSIGTKAGTHQVAGIKGAYPGGLFPSYFFTYGGMALFAGLSGYLGAPVHSLWLTKGTAASTIEIGGANNHLIKNANQFSGLMAYFQGFTLFNGLAYFDGYDAAGNIGLWRTNGTATGTFEIAPIAGAATVGSPGSDIQPAYMCVVGTKMFFAGADLTDAQYGLWVTDGTAKGTYEVGGQGDKGVKGSPYQNAMNLTVGIGPIDLTAFGGKALFDGTDNTIRPTGYYAHTQALWVTNGTAAGTVEIGGHGSALITNANKALNGGLLGGVSNPDFTVYNKEVLFVGRDDYGAIGHVGLWVTNGTVAGTREVGGLDNVGIKGGLTLSGDPKSPDFTVFDGKVLFTGMNNAGQWGIWQTDGTAAGTHMLAHTTPNAYPNTDFTLATI